MYDFVLKYCHGNMYLYEEWVNSYANDIRLGSSIESAQNKAFEKINCIIEYDLNGKY